MPGSDVSMAYPGARICKCQHFSDLHANNGFCQADGCTCRQFQEVDFEDSDFGRAMMDWLGSGDEPTLKAPGGAMSYRFSHTTRGFQIVFFTDLNGETGVLQQSSRYADPPGTSAIWLGREPLRPENKQYLHLDVEGVRSLVALLNSWLETGYFIVQARRRVALLWEEEG